MTPGSPLCSARRKVLWWLLIYAAFTIKDPLADAMKIRPIEVIVLVLMVAMFGILVWKFFF